VKTILIILFVFLDILVCQPKLNEAYVSFNLKVEWLANVKNTVRISSNHYSDFVIDNENNAYLASFATNAENKDEIYIAKVSEDGKILWEMGENVLGRATAIGIDSLQNIWVVGIFEGTIEFENTAGEIQSETQFAGTGGFVANFNSEGKLLKLVTSNGNIYPTNCEVRKGVVVVSGETGQSLQFGFKRLEKIGDNQHFLAAFKLNGTCHWIKSTSTDFSKISSDNNGNFYLIGTFNGEINFDNVNIQSAKNEGFIIKIDADGNVVFAKKISESDESNYSISAVGDFFISKDSLINIVVTKRDVNPHFIISGQADEIETIFVFQFTNAGKLVSQNEIISNTVERSVVTISQDSNQGVILTCTGKNHYNLKGKDFFGESNRQALVIHLNEHFEVLELLKPKSPFDGAFRASFSKNGNVWLSGHYRGEFVLGDNSIVGENGHNLFLAKVKI
jgi:hypothetical protein